MMADDVYVLCHLEDHNYSLGTNNYYVKDEDGAVEPCTTTYTPGPKDQSLTECDVTHNEMNIDKANLSDDDALIDSGSIPILSFSF